MRKNCRSSTNQGCTTTQSAANDRHRYSQEDLAHANRNIMNAYADQGLLTLNLKVFFAFRSLGLINSVVHTLQTSGHPNPLTRISSADEALGTRETDC